MFAIYFKQDIYPLSKQYMVRQIKLFFMPHRWLEKKVKIFELNLGHPFMCKFVKGLFMDKSVFDGS